MALHFFWIALAVYRAPEKALAVLKDLMRKRRLLRGDFPFLKYVKAGSRYYWSLNHPGWPSSSFRPFCEHELNKVRPFRSDNGRLSTIIFAITNECPLRCEHCYEWRNLGGPEPLSLDDLKEILAKFQRRGVGQVQLSGGEPLCRLEDAVELIRSARAGTDFWLLTSGYELTFEKAARLKEAGLTGVDVSLDHWDEERHNAFRNDERSFYWAREAAFNTRGADLAVCLSLCATRDFVTPENLWRYVHLAKEWGAGFVRILEPRAVGHYAGRDVELKEEHVDVLTRFYLAVNADPACRELPIVTYPGYGQRRVGCVGAGNRYLYVDSNGDVHACPFCRNEVGNALAGSLDGAIAKMRKIGCHEFETNAWV
jgi:MoaA/NifB/PqqE/SkfB family radical SAM enzyme